MCKIPPCRDRVFLEYCYHAGLGLIHSYSGIGKDDTVTMIVPTRDECIVFMKKAQMPVHIRKHSFLVAEIALYLGRLLNGNSRNLNLELIEAGALLHDIAKVHSLSTGERHEDLGARMLWEWGYRQLATIVRDHVRMEPSHLAGPVTESLLVNYADKRVKHDQIVSLEDRFHDLMNRYAKTEEHRVRLQEKLHLYFLLERKIFEPLTIDPTESELMSLSIKQATANRTGEL